MRTHTSAATFGALAHWQLLLYWPSVGPRQWSASAVTKSPSCVSPAHLAVELQGGGGHVCGTQLNKTVPPLGVHRHIHHRVQPCSGVGLT